jgi:hypothetical protein
MPSTAKRTRYAAADDGLVCLLLDIRGQARPNSLQVFSYSKNRVINLPRRRRDGRDLIRIETPEAKRWAAVSVPRWLANSEGLHGKPDLPPVETEFCRQTHADERTEQQKRDDHERSLAQFVVDQQNKYRRLPGQRWGFTQSDFRSGRIFE